MPWPAAGCKGGKSGTLSPNGPAYLSRTKWHGNGRGTSDIFRATTFRELLAYSGFYGPAALLSPVSRAMDCQREGRDERCPRIILVVKHYWRHLASVVCHPTSRPCVYCGAGHRGVCVCQESCAHLEKQDQTVHPQCILTGCLRTGMKPVTISPDPAGAFNPE